MDISSLEINRNLEIKRNVSGSSLSMFGSGGRIDVILYPRSTVQLMWALTELENQRYYILGAGSNTLISDDGSRDIIISITRLNSIDIDGQSLIAEAGAPLSRLCRIARENELSGLEQLNMIPGTVGGAIFMNAGAYGADIGSLVEYADIFIDGRLERLLGRELDFSYRRSGLMEKGGALISVKLNLIHAQRSEIEREELRCNELRISSQPKGRSLGSVFKGYNGVPAAKYIEQLNIKGIRCGGAMLSEKHCNFIINAGGATTSDYLSLARLVQDKVAEKFNIRLAVEIRWIGEENEDFRRLSHPYGDESRQRDGQG